MIVGLSGKKGSGKSTVAEFLHREIEGSARVPFAFKLKELAQECFGASVRQVNGDEGEKNTPTECGLTGREVMQAIGGGMRRIWPDCWVFAWEREVAGMWAEHGAAFPVIVEDVRYPNEVAAIKRMGGIVIRLTRTAHGEDLHESEIALDGYAGFDGVIMNQGMTVGETCWAALDTCRAAGVV